MKSSGIRRGLAVVAVSAVAVVGLMPLAAQANPIEDQMDNQFGSGVVTMFGPHQN